MKKAMMCLSMVAVFCIVLASPQISQAAKGKTISIAPNMISPKGGAPVDRQAGILLRWQPLKGVQTYEVDIDCYGCKVAGHWNGETYNNAPWKNVQVSGTSYMVTDFPAKNRGRWRVRAVKGKHHEVHWSDYEEFMPIN